MPVSRRNFLKGAAAATGVAVLSTMPATVGAAAKQPKWDETYDIVIAGYGGAGAAAAVAAHDRNAKVLILEKLPTGGGNTAVSSGGYIISNNYEQTMKYILKLYEFDDSVMDKEQVEVFVKGCLKLKDYVKTLQEGLDQYAYGFASYQHLEGYDSIEKVRIKGKKKGGDCLFDAFQYAVETVRKIPIYYNSPVKELVTNADGVVIGVTAEVDGKVRNICANRAVILTTGGFEYNTEMLRNYFKGYPIYSLGSPGNTGDGIKMAQKVGADLWHMKSGTAPMGVMVPGVTAALQLNMLAPSHFWVDQHAERFIDEKGFDYHVSLMVMDAFDGKYHKFHRMPCYMIFDEKAKKRGSVLGGATSGYALNRENYVWSKDNEKEIASGVIKKGNTIEELATQINVDPAILKKTLEKWNKDIAAGADTLFGRRLYASTDGKPIFEGREAPVVSEVLTSNGPYYAIALYPVLYTTQGGPRRNARCEVLDPFGKPIPRLYSAGEMGSFWGSVYQGAGHNADSMVFGPIAGKNAAELKPWKK